MSEAPVRKLLTPNGGLPTGNWPESELVEYVRADLFAALEAERDELTHDLARLKAEQTAAVDEAERLRADLAKAVDVIDWALICWDDHQEHGYNMQGDWVCDARAALASIKGDQTDG